MTGYLPSLVTGETPFKGNPVYVLESNRYYDPVWFYDSPLPERFDPIFAAHQTEGVPNTSTKEEDRKSFLATPLFLDTDFWINLPVYTDHQVLGRQRRARQRDALERLEHRALLPLAGHRAGRRRRDERDPGAPPDLALHASRASSTTSSSAGPSSIPSTPAPSRSSGWAPTP